MLPPESITNALSTMDPLLSVRWGEHVGRWVIERTAVTPIVELKWLRKKREREEIRCRRPNATANDRLDLAGICEEIVSLERGKRVILMVDRVDAQVYNALCLGDMKRYGGYSRYADKVEADEFAANERDNEKFAAWIENAAREAFGYGNGGVSPYDFMMSKKRKGVLLEVQKGQRTLKSALGLREDQSILSDSAPVESSTRTKILFDSNGRALAPIN